MEQVQETFRVWRKESEDLLAEHHYKLLPEEVKELEDDGVSQKLLNHVPKIMAKVYMDSMTSTMNQVITHLPKLVGLVIEAQEKATKGKQEFFKSWPALEQHEQVVMRIGQEYRARNPRASKADFIREVGAASMVALRLPMASQPAAPAPTQPRQFRPAAAARPAAPPSNQPQNPFAAMIDDEDRMEEEM